MRTLSFITANYVGRALNYANVTDWGENERATLAAASPAAFAALATDVAAAGFEAVDLWTAHCHWRHHVAPAFGEDYAEQIKGICSQCDLAITSYAGGLSVKSPADLDAPFRFMKQLGAPIFAGGIGGLGDAELPAAVDAACQKYGVRWAFENHPQKSAGEMLDKIGHGRYPRCGIALDTGWCGTQGLDALEAAKAVREHLFLVHLKDVTLAGAHETCALGEGVVPVEKVVRYLVESDWHGGLCIEHEPYDRDPMPEVRRSLERVRAWLRG